MTTNIYLVYTYDDNDRVLITATTSLERMSKAFFKESLFNWRLENMGFLKPKPFVVEGSKFFPHLDFRTRYYHTYIDIIKDEE